MTKISSSAPTIRYDPATSQEFILEGHWSGRSLGQAEKLLKAELKKVKSSFRVVLENALLDTNGAYLLVSTLKGRSYEVSATPFQEVLLSDAHRLLKKKKPAPPSETHPFLQDLLERTGKMTMDIWELAKKLLDFFWHIVLMTGRTFGHFRWSSIGYHIEDFGVNAVPIISLTSFLIGMVLAYQGINQLSRFGAELFTVDFLGIGILRELGVLMTSIVIAGRSGSAIAAQIGTMCLNQEIDAIRMMGLTPLEILVIPRLIGLLIALPCLVFLSDVIGILGGMVMSKIVIGLPFNQFLNQLQKAVSTTHFWIGMSKAPLFAIIISLVGCFRGFQVKGSAAHVGEMTTRAVVESIFLVIIFDAFISIMYSYMGI